VTSATLERVIEIVSHHSGVLATKLSATSAIDQDVGISGGDIDELAEALAKEFGDHIWRWPWQRFASVDEGLPMLFPFLLLWQLVSWPIRGSFSYPSTYERLELGHIAAVIERGEWLEP